MSNNDVINNNDKYIAHDYIINVIKDNGKRTKMSPRK